MSEPTSSGRLLHGLSYFERGVVILLIGLMMLTVALSTFEVAVLLVTQIRESPLGLIGVDRLLDVFGLFLMILLGLELLETIKAYLIEHAIHVEIVMVVALIAIARKVIILDIKTVDSLAFFAVGFILLALSVGYFLISTVHKTRHPSRSRGASNAGKDSP